MKSLVLIASILAWGVSMAAEKEDAELRKLLKKEGFTGKIEDTLEKRLGRKVDVPLADLGKSIFFDKALGLHKSNSCAGCHSPTHGFGDTQSIARGIQNNDIVGAAPPPAGRDGPRNQRRTPTIVNTAFYPALMWNGRFSSLSGDPFNNSKGFEFPPPEKDLFVGGKDPRFKHLLVAQAHIPFTEMPEMAGFHGLFAALEPNAPCNAILPKMVPLRGQIRTPGATQKSVLRSQLFDAPAALNISPDSCQFDDKAGTALPRRYPDVKDVLSPAIRQVVLLEINTISGYREKFGDIYPQVKAGNDIDFWMIGQALAEFQIQQTYAKAPIDKYAAGDSKALSPAAKQGAIAFFGKAQCVACHAVKGPANEMFSDFKNHNAGVPQIAPLFGKGTGNVPFRELDGSPTSTGVLDLGRFEVELDKPETRFQFRTSPLRNVSLQPAFFHNGSFTRLEDAVRYHLNTAGLAKTYDPAVSGVAPDLKKPVGSSDPTDKVLATLHPRLAKPPKLTETEIKNLVAFLAEGLLDERAKPDSLMKVTPSTVLSGAKLPTFIKP